MKRILIALTLLASFSLANAQVKSPADAAKALNSAKADTQNPKKAEKAATWVKLGKAYMDAYNAPIGNAWVGASRQELSLLMGNDKAVSETQVEVSGEQMLKVSYADKDFYYNANGQLAIIMVTKPVAENALENAVQAYAKAYSLDAKKTTKAVAAALNDIQGKLTNDAYNAYRFGDLESASKYFAAAAEAVANEPLAKLDTLSLYNAGFTALAADKKEVAKGYFEKCLEAGYYAESGEIFAKLATVDEPKAGYYLEEGFKKFPQSQSILIGLINYYLQSGDNPEKLFDLLDAAKKNEPNNPSLYYVEGNIRNELKQRDLAVEAYRACAKIDPNYEYGYIGEGVMRYNHAIEIQEEAQNEIDDAKYAALVEAFSAELKACIEPFELAFQTTKDNGIKVSIAEYLKNAYYRFHDDSEEYQAGYDKYNKIVKSGTAE